MLNQLLERLAHLEELAPNPITDAEVISLIETVAAQPKGLQILVENYSNSSLTIVARSLSFILAVKSSSAEVFPFLLTFIEKLDAWEDEAISINCLTALQRQLRVINSADEVLKNTNFLAEFILNCLNQSIKLKLVTLGAIARIYESNLLLAVFNETQIIDLREKLTELSKSDEPLLEEAVKKLTKQGEIIPISRIFLTGSELLKKVKELSHLGSRAIAKQCGYYTFNKNNHYRANLTEFYRELRKAKRLYPDFLESKNGKQSEPSYRLFVQENGEILIEEFYVKAMGLKPDDLLEIKLTDKQILLIEIEQDLGSRSPKSP